MRSFSLNSNRPKIRSFLFTLTCVGLVSYFCYQMISGPRGIIAYFKINGQISSFQSELELVRAERISIEHNANLLKSDSLDLDLLEQQAKAILGYARPQEMVLIDE